MAKLSMRDTAYNPKYKSKTQSLSMRDPVYNPPKDTPEPTIGDAYKSANINYGDTGYDQTLGQIGNYYAGQFNTDYNEKDIYRQNMKRYQREIDAVNDIYRQQLKQAQMEGEGRLGSQTAIGARAGILGSDFAEAQKAEVQGYNNDIYKSIGAEKAAKIAAITGKANESAVKEIEAKRLAKQQGAESYLAFLGSQSERKKSRVADVVSQLLDQEVDPSELDPKELKAIAQTLGTTPEALKSQFLSEKATRDASQAETDLKTRKTEAEISKIEADIATGKLIKLGEGDMLYDPETGETFKNPKTYKPESGGTAAAGGIVDANGKPIKLTATQVDTLTSFDNATQSAARALNLLNQGVATGPLANVLHGVNKFADTANPTALQLEQTLSKMKADYMKALSGAAVSEAEVKRLARFLPDLSDQEGVLQSKLQNLTRELGQSKSNFLNTLGATGGTAATQNEDVRSKVEAAGYDYDAMKADGLSDAEIEASL